jgi:hypothetical protein
MSRLKDKRTKFILSLQETITETCLYKRKLRMNNKRESFAQSINRHSMEKDHLESRRDMKKQKKWRLCRCNMYKGFDKLTKGRNPKFVTYIHKYGLRLDRKWT